MGSHRKAQITALGNMTFVLHLVQKFRRDKPSDKDLSENLFVQKLKLSQNLSRRKFVHRLRMRNVNWLGYGNQVISEAEFPS